MVIIERYEFTYQDYLNYCDSFYFYETKKEYLCLAEPETEYIYNEKMQEEIRREKSGDKKHDKIFKDILQDNEEVAKLLKFFVKYEIEAERLEQYNANYITKNFKYKQADIVYKIKGEQIYFLVEHQTKVDFSMAYRILNYCVEIMRGVVEGKQINRSSFKYPKIIPIVLYTGNKKWTVSNSFAKIQIEDKNFETKNIDAKYQLIDINEYEIEELLKQKTMLANAMILEKSKSFEDVSNNLTMMLKNTPKGKLRGNLKRIVMFLYQNFNEEEKNKIIKIIEESEGEGNMLTAKRIIDAELRKQRREGILEMTVKVIRNMLQQNEDEEKIMRYTNTKKEDIENVRRQLNM